MVYGFRGKYIATWDDMKMIFLQRYQDYYKSRDVKEEIFNIMQKEDKNMEEFVECFQYSLQILCHCDLDKYFENNISPGNEGGTFRTIECSRVRRHITGGI